MGLEFSPKLMQKKIVLFSLPPSTFLWKCLYILVFSRWKRIFYLPPIFHFSRALCLKMLIVMPTMTDCNTFYNSKIGQVTMMEMPSIPP